MRKFLILLVLIQLKVAVVAQRFVSYSFAINHPIKHSDFPTFRKTGLTLGFGLGKLYTCNFSYEANFNLSVWGRKNYNLFIDYLNRTTKTSRTNFDFSISVLGGYRLNRFEFKNGITFGYGHFFSLSPDKLYIDPDAFNSKHYYQDWFAYTILNYQLRLSYEISSKVLPFIELNKNLKKTYPYFNHYYDMITLGLIIKISRSKIKSESNLVSISDPPS